MWHWIAGGHRTCTCAALGQGAQLVQVSRQLFMSFVMARPRTLQIYLHKVVHPLLNLPFSPMPSVLADTSVCVGQAVVSLLACGVVSSCCCLPGVMNPQHGVTYT